MRIKCNIGTTLLFSLLVSASALATSMSPIGRWITYDLDRTPRSEVQIYATGNTLSGKIVKLLNPAKGTKLDPKCTNCEGALKGKPQVGLVVITGLKREGDKWTGGKIVNADDGKVYDCEISLDETGKILHFRGYQGLPVFGKTIEWDRVGAPKAAQTPAKALNKAGKAK